MDNTWQTRTRRVAHGVRKRVLELTLKNNGCYLSQTLSSADVLATLYTKALNIGPSEAPFMPTMHPGVPGENGIEAGYGASYNGPRGPESDRLLISPAHYAVAIYATLAETGRLSPEAFFSFNTEGSTIEMIGAEHSPGFEPTTGSFGQPIITEDDLASVRIEDVKSRSTEQFEAL